MLPPLSLPLRSLPCSGTAVGPSHGHQHDLPGQSLDGRIDVFLHEDEVPEWVINNCSSDAASDDDETARDRTVILRDATLRWHAGKPADQKKAPQKTSFLSALKFWRSRRMRDGRAEVQSDDAQEENCALPVDCARFPTSSERSHWYAAPLVAANLRCSQLSLARWSWWRAPSPCQTSSAIAQRWCRLLLSDSMVETMSIRDNIVFGQHFDQNRYDKVLECCCLVPDLKTFPDSDHTEIGENGVSLSVVRRRELPWLARSTLVRPFFSSMMFWPPSTRTRPEARGTTAFAVIWSGAGRCPRHASRRGSLGPRRACSHAGRRSHSRQWLSAELKAEGLLSMLISESTALHTPTTKASKQRKMS